MAPAVPAFRRSFLSFPRNPPSSPPPPPLQNLCRHSFSPTSEPPNSSSATLCRAAALLNSAVLPSHLSQIHAILLASGLLRCYPFLAAKLLLSAADLGLIPQVSHLFDEIPRPSVPLWNAAIRLHSRHGAFADALNLYDKMLHRGAVPDGLTLPPVLKACGGLPDHIVRRAVCHRPSGDMVHAGRAGRLSDTSGACRQVCHRPSGDMVRAGRAGRLPDTRGACRQVGRIALQHAGPGGSA